MTKRKHKALTGILFLAVLFFGFRWLNSPRRFLQGSDEFVFYSLSPDTLLQPSNAGSEFHRIRVLGKVTITDPAEKDALIDTLFKSFNNGFFNAEAECHEPRHGIRAVRGNRTMDLTVCFQCTNVEFYADGQHFLHKTMSRAAKELFNQTLQKHHLPLAKE